MTALTPEDAQAQALREGNPIIVACAHAGWEAVRAYRKFCQDVEGHTAWDALDPAARADIMNDAFMIISGKSPQEIYEKYDHGGMLWEAAFADVKLRYVLFARTVATTLSACSALAQAAQDVIRAEEGLSDGS